MGIDISRNNGSCFCFSGYDYCYNDVDCYCKTSIKTNTYTTEDAKKEPRKGRNEY